MGIAIVQFEMSTIDAREQLILHAMVDDLAQREGVSFNEIWRPIGEQLGARTPADVREWNYRHAKVLVVDRLQEIILAGLPSAKH